MSKIVLIGWREFRQRVRSRGFLLGALGTPLLLLAIWLFSSQAGGSTSTQSPLARLAQTAQSNGIIGYVDQAGLIRTIPTPIPAEAFRSFPSTAAAEAALAAGEIEAYYIVPTDYRQTGRIRRVSPHLPAGTADTSQFDWVLLANLLPGTEPDELARLRWPFNAQAPRFVPVHAGEAGPASTLSPFIITIAVIVPLFTSGSYLLQSLAQEKSSRILEILLVSLRPDQLLTGKLLGLGALTLVQYLIWAAIALAVLRFTGREISEFLAGVNLAPADLLLILLYALGGFALYAAVMAGIGALAPDPHNSRTWVFVLTLPMIIPIYLWVAIVSAPHSPLAIALSLFPFSAPVAMLMRIASTSVPVWQLGVSLLFLLLTAIAMIWLMARLFRVQTLLSGEALSIRRFVSALRSPSL